ncbi:hypothetical protein RYA05_00820 [Pseudomonas syringae pv. actinidiae]|nr:hypothetical protein [Pseudomonas syringae pv. actinidiae]
MSNTDQESLRKAAQEKLEDAEKSWHDFANACDQASLDRERAFSVAEKIRLARRIFG